jgi:hypothetical protein
MLDCSPHADALVRVPFRNWAPRPTDVTDAGPRYAARPAVFSACRVQPGPTGPPAAHPYPVEETVRAGLHGRWWGGVGGERLEVRRPAWRSPCGFGGRLAFTTRG